MEQTDRKADRRDWTRARLYLPDTEKAKLMLSPACSSFLFFIYFILFNSLYSFIFLKILYLDSYDHSECLHVNILFDKEIYYLGLDNDPCACCILCTILSCF